MAGRILGPDGHPISLDELQTEIATPQLSGVRQVWHPIVSGGMTPEELVVLLEHSVHHDPERYLQLCEEIEEKYPHYFAQLSTRKLAVESVDIQVEAVSDDKDDVRIADATRAMLGLECAEDCRGDLMDALAKSFSVCEILWDRSGREWMPKSISHVEPRWFMFDRETQRQIRLKDDADRVNGIALRPFKFMVHRPRLKSGLPIRNGLGRVATVLWLLWAYMQKDWWAFAEVFGMPIRVGKYGANASDKDVALLRRAVANIGTDAACVMPQSMVIEFEQLANVTGAADLFERGCEYIDRQTSKVVLGQTMSSDAQAAGMGSGNANLHGEVRDDIRDADCGQLARTIRRDLVRPFVDMNFGQRAPWLYPKVIIRKKKPEDIKGLTDALRVFVPQGLEVEQSEVRDKLGLKEPEPGAKLLRAQPTGMLDFGNDGDGLETALNRRRALNAAQPAAAGDAIDQLVDEALLDWHEQMEEIVDPIEQLAAECADEEEFLRRLPELVQTVEPAKLLKGLALGAFKARGLGDATDKT